MVHLRDGSHGEDGPEKAIDQRVGDPWDGCRTPLLPGFDQRVLLGIEQVLAGKWIEELFAERAVDFQHISVSSFSKLTKKLEVKMGEKYLSDCKPWRAAGVTTGMKPSSRAVNDWEAISPTQ